MNPAAPLPFPGSRTVAAWWRQLSHLSPQRLWLTHLLLHRVEALAEVVRPEPVNGLHRALLGSLAAGGCPEGLEPGILSRLTRELTAAGLVSRTDAGLRPTDAGRRALATGTRDAGSRERRTFYFVDNSELGRQPHFLPVLRPGAAVTPPETWGFDPQLLQDAARQDPRWRQRFGFPADVAAIRLPLPDAPDWQEVVLDRAERLFAVAAQLTAQESGPRFVAFACQTEGWVLDAGTPSVDMGEGWAEALPDLATDPPAESWRAAWEQWCQPRGLPPAEVAACRLERQGHQVRVTVSRRLMARLRELRSDALKGETWLLAGTGRSRAAARVEVSERAS